MKLSTEAILTQVYRVPATPVQIAVCRARDGVPLGAELAAREDVQAAFGGPEAIAALPGERGIKPAEFWIIASARTAKTTIAVAGALADLFTLDLSSLGPGEVPRVSITSVKLDTADVPYKRLAAAFESTAFKPLLIEQRDSDRMLVVRHPSGTPVEIAVVAGGKAAGGLASRWCAGFIPDEAPKQAGRDDSTTNLSDCLSVVRERMLVGAQIAPVGSPWSPSGDAYDAVQEFFGKPTDDTVVVRMTGPTANPVYWTPERLAKLERRDPVAWRINALGEFLDPESGLLNPVSVRSNTRELLLELVSEDGATYAFAVDTSEGMAGNNPWALVGVEAFAAEDELLAYKVAVAREWRGIRPEQAWIEIAQICQRYGVSTVDVDQYAASANADLARQQGLILNVRPWSAANKLEAFVDLATLIHSDRVELSPDKTLRRDLLSVKKRVTQSGQTIHLPRTSDGRHCDYAPALAAAVRAGRWVYSAASEHEYSDWFNSQPTKPPAGYNFGSNRSTTGW